MKIELYNENNWNNWKTMAESRIKEFECFMTNSKLPAIVT